MSGESAMSKMTHSTRESSRSTEAEAKYAVFTEIDGAELAS